jgi:prepilin-type processing-associated H-X9-DG protein
MDIYSCPHCKHEITTSEQDADVATHCPHCGKTFSNGEQQATHSSPTPVYTWIGFTLNALTLFVALGLGLLLYYAPAYHLYLWAPKIHLFAGVGILCGIIRIITGYLSQCSMRENTRLKSIRRGIRVGIALCCISIVLIIVFAYLAPLKNVGQRVNCFSNLKVLGLSMAFYAEGHPERMRPQLSSTKGRLMFMNDVLDGQSLYPHYFGDPRILICPADFANALSSTDLSARFTEGSFDSEKFNPEDFFEHSSYCYLGYQISNDEEMRAFAEAYKQRIKQGLPFDTDLEVPPGTGTDGGDKILRLRQRPKIDFETCSEEEKQAHWKRGAETAVLWDRCSLAPDQNEPLFCHQPNGINVLFLDGHSEFIRYGEGRWPATEETLRLFWELQNL